MGNLVESRKLEEIYNDITEYSSLSIEQAPLRANSSRDDLQRLPPTVRLTSQDVPLPMKVLNESPQNQTQREVEGGDNRIAQPHTGLVFT